MLPNKEGDVPGDVLGEEPVAHTTNGDPIFRQEGSIYRVYDEIKADQLVQPLVTTKPPKRSYRRSRQGGYPHPSDASRYMEGIGRGRYNR